jgi:hypothetical protein
VGGEPAFPAAEVAISTTQGSLPHHARVDVGNLLETLLCKRSPQRKALTIQSDLATVNLVADEELRRRFDMRSSGGDGEAVEPAPELAFP